MSAPSRPVGERGSFGYFLLGGTNAPPSTERNPAVAPTVGRSLRGAVYSSTYPANDRRAVTRNLAATSAPRVNHAGAEGRGQRRLTEPVADPRPWQWGLLFVPRNCRSSDGRGRPRSQHSTRAFTHASHLLQALVESRRLRRDESKPPSSSPTLPSVPLSAGRLRSNFVAAGTRRDGRSRPTSRESGDYRAKIPRRKPKQID
jgi:hypothetical protein